MDTQRTCPSCGRPVSADAPQGLCPECLMKGAMASSVTGAPNPHGFVPPGVAEMARLFPQLEILDLIGHGGMGAVYKARQPGLDRLVALKILPPRPGQDPGFADRFTREARALAKLSHPNIVAVYDFGQAGGLHYFLMEYVDGPNLRQVEQSGRLSPREALKIIPQLCEALQFAHDEGIVHRDIKPENVLLDKKGRVKIADFGLAKLLGQEAQAYRLTGTKDVMGTPHYMAPEQFEHPQAVDHRADSYSLGVVFYEMLTGELPLGRFGPPSARTKDVSIDVRLDQVVLRTLEREPERRYQHASEVKTDLDNIAGSSGAKAPLVSPATENESARQERLRKEVRAPAIGLLATGILNWCLLPLIMYLILPAISGAQAYGMQGGGMPRIALGVLLSIPFLLCSFMIYAALKMMRFESYRAAIGASIAGMLVTPGNLIGFPVGIWALITLLRKEVRSAFTRVRAEQAATRGSAGAVKWVLWGGGAVVVVAALVSLRSLHFGPVIPDQAPRVLLASSGADRPTVSQDLVQAPDGSLEASCTSTQVFRLFEVADPAVENCVLIYQAKVKAEHLTGRAYLEMWCRLPGSGESFSRGLDNVISGTTGWATTQTPFFLKEGEKPDLIRLNLVVEGSGKVFIKDIRLETHQR
jgi:predicted Ser/Thr protein kinase